MGLTNHSGSPKHALSKDFLCGVALHIDRAARRSSGTASGPRRQISRRRTEIEGARIASGSTASPMLLA
eukprot:5889714-Alexandrium_andersonii.AAC.1